MGAFVIRLRFGTGFSASNRRNASATRSRSVEPRFTEGDFCSAHEIISPVFTANHISNLLIFKDSMVPLSPLKSPLVPPTSATKRESAVYKAPLVRARNCLNPGSSATILYFLLGRVCAIRIRARRTPGRALRRIPGMVGSIWLGG